MDCKARELRSMLFAEGEGLQRLKEQLKLMWKPAWPAAPRGRGDLILILEFLLESCFGSPRDESSSISLDASSVERKEKERSFCLKTDEIQDAGGGKRPEAYTDVRRGSFPRGARARRFQTKQHFWGSGGMVYAADLKSAASRHGFDPTSPTSVDARLPRRSRFRYAGKDMRGHRPSSSADSSAQVQRQGRRLLWRRNSASPSAAEPRMPATRS